jgi:SAM-dependent methyltransferase
MENGYFKSDCHTCGGKLSHITSFSEFLQVTSDCRPWRTGGNLVVCESCGTVQKLVNETWLKEVEIIYGQYEIYSQSGGVEQIAFDQITGAAKSRSKKLVEWLTNNCNLPSTGKLLDVGCGNGAFLRAFGSTYPEWLMTGLELNDRNREVVEAISGVQSLYVGSVGNLQDKFNVISLIHALEHIPDPSRFLHGLKEKLLPGGILLIEVPNLKTSPFDILIADHCTHFTATSLSKVLDCAQFSITRLDEDYIPKELTVAIEVKNSLDSPSQPQSDASREYTQNTEYLSHHVGYLQSLLDLANSVTGNVGVLGTSIAGTWLAESVNSKVKFFLDEDPSRIGRYHLKRPIIAPDEVEDGAFVLVPLPHAIAVKVAKRLSHLNCNFLTVKCKHKSPNTI